jgi:hypothetical protein
MDALGEFLDSLKGQGLAQGNLLGLLHILIGRRIARADGTLISNGVTWRTLAAALKRVRWDREAVRDLGLDPAELPPRDRERYWYAAIARSGVDSDRAAAAGDRLAKEVRSKGINIGPPPGRPR